jgi:hypothetical protein
VQARRGSPSEAAPRTGHDGDAPRKISVFHQENCRKRGDREDQ